MADATALRVGVLGQCVPSQGVPLLEGASWYMAPGTGDGLVARFAPGTLSCRAWLTWDAILDGADTAKFCISLRESPEGNPFVFTFAMLPAVQARVRVPLSATDLNRWMFDREGAFLKPLAGGAKVDPDKVTTLELTVAAKGDDPVRWCMTDIRATANEPPLLANPLTPSGVLLDGLGQSTLRRWPGRTRNRDETTARLRNQREQCASRKWPDSFSRWGGWNSRKAETTGFFRTWNDGRRWWLVDPDGHPFWSAGVDCVRVDTSADCKGIEKALADPSIAAGGPANFLAANFRAAFGDERWHDAWTDVTLGHLRSIGFNTFGNWSEWRIASKAGFPFVRPLERRGQRAAADIFRDFPDVFHPDYDRDCREFASQLEATVTDRAMVGYFLMNEPTWGFAEQVPALGMLFNTDSCATRTRFAGWLKDKYGDDSSFQRAWSAGMGLETIERGRLRSLEPGPGAAADLKQFSTLMVERLFETLSRSCKAVDPNHLNLGARYYTVPPAWAMKGMACFDVFSVNCYITPRVRREMAVVPEAMGCPVLIGEWHFGALDAGLPATGIGRVRTQADRGKAYRVYCEDAAAQPWCVGVHWFTLYDQSAAGRFDGECYNIGFLDICNRPYDELCAAARSSHERIYLLASGAGQPYGEEPEYLTPLFF
jgi:hypothetical protein